MQNFNPLSPCGERLRMSLRGDGLKDFNPLSPCGERHGWDFYSYRGELISIHSPHAGRD